MIEHMKKRICQGCGGQKIPHDSHESHYCSNECKDKMERYRYRSNIQSALGLWHLGAMELIEISCKLKHLNSEKIEEITITL